MLLYCLCCPVGVFVVVGRGGQGAAKAKLGFRRTRQTPKMLLVPQGVMHDKYLIVQLYVPGTVTVVDLNGALELYGIF